MVISSGDADRIRPVKQNVEDDLIARSGVVAVDIGEKVTDGEVTGEPAILVFVEHKRPLDEVPEDERIPAAINGVRTDVVEMQIELQTPLVKVDDDIVAQLDPGSYRPLRGGTSMGPDRSFWLEPPEVPVAGNYRSVGTLGAFVTDRASGARMALTNFHVAAVDTAWSVGDVMVQPGHPDGAGVGFGRLSRAVLSENVDGAVVAVDAGVGSECDVVDIGRITGSRAAAIGMAVRKRGRTTNLTASTVASVDATVSVPYGDGLGTRTLRNQIRINRPAAGPRFSDRGDSGSVIVDDDERVVGLLFAGAVDGSTTFANPIAAVLNELGVDLCVQQDLPIISRSAVPCTELKTRIQVSCYDFRSRILKECITLKTRTIVDCSDLRTRIRIICEGIPVPEWPKLPGEGPGFGPASRYGVERDLEESFWIGYAAAYDEMQALQESGGKDAHGPDHHRDSGS